MRLSPARRRSAALPPACYTPALTVLWLMCCKRAAQYWWGYRSDRQIVIDVWQIVVLHWALSATVLGWVASELYTLHGWALGEKPSASFNAWVESSAAFREARTAYASYDEGFAAARVAHSRGGLGRRAGAACPAALACVPRRPEWAACT